MRSQKYITFLKEIHNVEATCNILQNINASTERLISFVANCKKYASLAFIERYKTLYSVTSVIFDK